jgi:hypothetical protein
MPAIILSAEMQEIDGSVAAATAELQLEQEAKRAFVLECQHLLEETQ